MSTKDDDVTPTTAAETFGALRLTPRATGSRLSVHAKPRASRSAVLGVRDGALDVALAAAPVGGAANDELIAVLAEALSIPKRDVEIVAGSTGRSKIVDVPLSAEEMRKRLSRGEKRP